MGGKVLELRQQRLDLQVRLDVPTGIEGDHRPHILLEELHALPLADDVPCLPEQRGGVAFQHGPFPRVRGKEVACPGIGAPPPRHFLLVKQLHTVQHLPVELQRVVDNRVRHVGGRGRRPDDQAFPLPIRQRRRRLRAGDADVATQVVDRKREVEVLGRLVDDAGDHEAHDLALLRGDGSAAASRGHGDRDLEHLDAVGEANAAEQPIGYRRLQPEWGPDGHQPLTDLHAVGVAQRDCWQLEPSNPQERHVALLVDGNQANYRVLLATRQPDRGFVGPRQHVCRRRDDPVAGQNEPAPRRSLGATHLNQHRRAPHALDPLERRLLSGDSGCPHEYGSAEHESLEHPPPPAVDAD